MLSKLSLKSFPFWLLTISAIAILSVSQLVQDGIFMDGMIYISVSKNLADGLGTFWDPYFNKVFTVFREQPPLYFGLLAVFFKLFGSGMYTERIFCFICMVLTAFYIHKIWRVVMYNNSVMRQHSWLPILFWMSIPVIFWAYANHVEETVMALFVIISIYYLFKALFRNERVILNLILAGIFIFLSSLTKGVQGIFPIAGVFFYWLISKQQSFKKMILYSLIVVAVPVFIYTVLILFNPHIYDAFYEYFKNRYGKTFFETVYNTTDYHFQIIVNLLSEMIPVFALTALILLLNRLMRIKQSKTNLTIKQLNNLTIPLAHRQIDSSTNWVLVVWFLCMALSGTLPLMITLEQRGFYLVTAIPLFVLSLTIYLSNKVSSLVEKIDITSKPFVTFRRVSVLMLVISVVFTALQIGKTKRDEEMLPDIYAIGKVIPHGEVVSTSTDVSYEFGFAAYFARYFYISLDAGNTKHTYFMIKKSLPKTLVPAGYKLEPIPTQYMDVYKK